MLAYNQLDKMLLLVESSLDLAESSGTSCNELMGDISGQANLLSKLHEKIIRVKRIGGTCKPILLNFESVKLEITSLRNE